LCIRTSVTLLVVLVVTLLAQAAAVAANEPIDPRIRLAIAQWPQDAPRGAVSTFCAEHDISRKTFYDLRKRAKSDGAAAVLEPRTRRPRSSPSKVTDDVKAQAVQVRAALEASGLDHGPISVHDKMQAMGLASVPSTATLARIFREAGVARNEPRKKPRSAWRRFVYPAPNACWQLDATEYVLTGGRTCVIFQLIDDHSRYAVASHVAVVRPPTPRSRCSTRPSLLTASRSGCCRTTGSRSTRRDAATSASSSSTCRDWA
jgi:putative transposase